MFQMEQTNGLQYVTVPSFTRTGLVRHGFSTRIGGVSTGEAASCNFGFNRKDTIDNIRQNFRLLCGAIGVDPQNLVLTHQVHGNHVHVARREDAGKKLWRDEEIAEMDGLVTNIPGLVLCTFHADCMPLFFLDPVKRAIGLAHSGWKGTYLDICGRTIAAMEHNFGTNPNDLLCAVGPSIGSCCFEVGEDVADDFASAYGDGYVLPGDKPHIDLWRLAKDQMTRRGVPNQNIVVTNTCTCCHTDVFYSYRGDHHKTGSMVSLMCLKD